MKELTNNQKQVIMSGVLGDGSLAENGRVIFSCIHREYLEFKKELLGDLAKEIRVTENNGYKKGIIYTLNTTCTEFGKQLYKKDIKDWINDLDELGLALWLYDDGSLHKKLHFFNINTHAQTEEVEREVLIPFLNKFNIYPRIMPERKKDGREFTYLFVGKLSGGFEISEILNKYPVDCFKYKMLPGEQLESWKKCRDYIGHMMTRVKTMTALIHSKDLDKSLSRLRKYSGELLLGPTANSSTKEPVRFFPK